MDLNADLGEGFGIWRLGDDDALLDLVTSANVACGFHGGDASTMRRVCARAPPSAGSPSAPRSATGTWPASAAGTSRTTSPSSATRSPTSSARSTRSAGCSARGSATSSRTARSTTRRPPTRPRPPRWSPRSAGTTTSCPCSARPARSSPSSPSAPGCGWSPRASPTGATCPTAPWCPADRPTRWSPTRTRWPPARCGWPPSGAVVAVDGTRGALPGRVDLPARRHPRRGGRRRAGPGRPDRRRRPPRPVRP